MKTKAQHPNACFQTWGVAKCGGKGGKPGPCPGGVDYNEHVYQVGKKIRNKEAPTQDDWDALDDDDRGHFQKMVGDYKPRQAAAPTPAPKVVKQSPLGIEQVEAKFSSTDKPDEYLYHVTTRGRADKIMNGGFKSGQQQSMDAGALKDYSKGKIFFADKPGVSFWQDRVEQHLQAQTDGEIEPLVVLRIPKNTIKGLQTDKPGTEDSRAGAYYADAKTKITYKEANDYRTDKIRQVAKVVEGRGVETKGH